MAKKKLNVFIENTSNLDRDLWESLGHTVVDAFKDADTICFTGGADVSPELYGEQCMEYSNVNRERDARCIEFFRKSEGMLRVGICRGGQFLNVMSGGKMFQDVNNHGRSHYLTDQLTRTRHLVSSTHHQMMRPGKGGLIVATASESDTKRSDGFLWRQHENRVNIATRQVEKPTADFLSTDIEVVWYADTRSLCFQPHPEYRAPVTTATYFAEILMRVQTLK